MGPSYLQAAGNGMQLLHSLYFDIYANYWATTTPNFLSDRYVMVGSWLNGAFQRLLCQMKLLRLSILRTLPGQEELDGENWQWPRSGKYGATTGILMLSDQSLTHSMATMQKTVPYDKQQDIYTAFFLELDSAENILKGLIR